MERTLMITGKGKLSVSPDLVIYRMPFVAYDYNYINAVDELNIKVNKFRDVLETLNIKRKDLKTLDFRVEKLTEYNQTTKNYDFHGFSAQHDIKFETPFDNNLTNKIILAIINFDTRIDFKITFGISDPESCLQQLIENAIQNAKKKASIIANASDVKLKEILNINYSFSDIYFHAESDLCYNSCPSMEDSNAMPDLNPEDIDMSENVTIIWRIE